MIQSAKYIFTQQLIAVLLSALPLATVSGLQAQDSIYDGEWSGDTEVTEQPGLYEENFEEDSENLEEGPSPEARIAWIEGPSTASLGIWAQLTVPEGYRFAGEEDAYQAREDAPYYRKDDFSPEYGLIRPADPNAEWSLLLTYDDWGYFERDGDRQLDAALIRRSYETDFAYANEWRADEENDRVRFVGWKIEPRFTSDGGAEWAALYREGELEIVDYVRAFAGRDGCLIAGATARAAAFDAILPAMRTVLGGLRFRAGRSYSDFTDGDPVAFVSLNQFLEDDIWTDERGGLNSVAAWLEKFVSVYRLDSPESWFESSDESAPPSQSPSGLHDGETDAGTRREGDGAWLARYWFYLVLIPVGVLLLWKFDSRRKSGPKRYGRQ